MSATPTMLVRDGKRAAFVRRFTKNKTDPYDGIKWVKRSAKITEKDGAVVFQMDDIEAPEFWSQLAVDIAASKYFRKAGVPTTGAEVSVRKLIDRVAGAVAGQSVVQGCFDEEEAKILKDEITYLLVHQYVAFNSPVWFNAGLFESYGVRGSASGNWFVDTKTKQASEVSESYRHPPLSACFIQTVDDTLMGIADGVKREMRVFKGGGGSGINYSSLRAENEPLSGGGKSSGVMSFLGIFDAAAGATKSGGTTRRAARMVVLNADHPDIETFVEWKVREEKKVAALVAAGYSSDFNGEAYRTIGGQNANNSVRVTDEFMQAVEGDREWSTVYRTTKKVAKTFKARALMRKIAEAAHSCADPGMQFDTACNEWNTTPESGRINCTNPCSEFSYVDNTACNLASLNLVRFMKDDSSFDVEGFCHAIDIFVTAMDLIVDYASYPTKEIAENSHNLRPLGLGYANLGALLMRLGLSYDSESGRALCGLLTALMTGRAYRRSAQLAAQIGPFTSFAFNRTPMLKVIRKHFDALDNIRPFVGGSDQFTALYSSLNAAACLNWQDAYAMGSAHGYRNAQTTLLAPTGTIGLLLDCDTTGIEPDYALVKYKKLAGGGGFKIVNQSVGPALERLGYNPVEIDGILKYIAQKDTIEGAPYLKESDLPVFDCAARCGEHGKRSLSPQSHLSMMAAAQPFLSGAISKTVNCAEETTIEEIENLYIQAWRLGLKAVAIYRENSKLCAILSGKKAIQVNDTVPVLPVTESGLVPTKRRRLPKRRTGFTQEVTVGGHKLYLRTGEYEDGTLGEVFLDMHKQGATMSAMLDSFAKLLSIAIQHGVPMEELVNTFTHTKFEPRGMVNGDPNIRMSSSILDYVFRTLAIEYLGRTDLTNRPVEEQEIQPKNGTHPPLNGAKPSFSNKAGETCQNCGDLTVRAGTCTVCLNCGTNSGCG